MKVMLFVTKMKMLQIGVKLRLAHLRGAPNGAGHPETPVGDEGSRNQPIQTQNLNKKGVAGSKEVGGRQQTTKVVATLPRQEKPGLRERAPHAKVLRRGRVTTRAMRAVSGNKVPASQPRGGVRRGQSGRLAAGWRSSSKKKVTVCRWITIRGWRTRDQGGVVRVQRKVTTVSLQLPVCQKEHGAKREGNPVPRRWKLRAHDRGGRGRMTVSRRQDEQGARPNN
mmetsp:Transcript_26233/g.60957  ORF Transcript_26233/g.60957 Transcript_26233/m.60957 type:complete len:224 (+) Transcript_26233:837-1508(+)